MKNFGLATETLGYQTSTDATNTDKRLLIGGSKNTLIDFQKKVKIRSGYKRLGAANASLTNVRNAWTWDTSTGQKMYLRFYDDELEVYLGTVDGTALDAWYRVQDGWSTTDMLRAVTFFDTTEQLDELIMVNGDDKMYEWNGAVAVVDSIAMAIAEAGDASNQMSAWVVNGTVTETNAGTNWTLYWKLTDAAGTRTVNVYSDSAGTAEVMTGTKVGDGTVTLAEANSSGLSGTVVVAYSGDDTTVSANTLAITWSITKTGTATWAQNRFYTSANKEMLDKTGDTQYSYTGGESTTTLTGVLPSNTNVSMDMIAGDVMMQYYVTNADKPAASRNNHTIGQHQNQVLVGSDDDEEVYVSKNSDYADFTFSSPRVSGEGALLTLTDPARGFGSIGELFLIFCGDSSIFRGAYNQLDVGGTLTETLEIKPLDIATNQGALCQEAIVPVGNSIFYLTNEVALRSIDDPNNVEGLQPKTLSTPIKPDFDAETWETSAGVPDAFVTWDKNTIYVTAPQASHVYMLNFVEDADGNLLRYWNPPQVLPAGPMTVIDSGTGNDLSNGKRLHIHSNSVPETYLLFEGASDGQYADMPMNDKLPIDAIAVFAYDDFGKRARLKNFDEYYVEGEITPSTTDLSLKLYYDVDGSTQLLEKFIDGSNEDIQEGSVQFNSLAQQSLGVNPLGSFLNPPSDAKKFNLVFELAKEDFFRISAAFSTNDVDKYWAIIAHGPNAAISRRKATDRRI
jgi:hypothetical protein